MNALAYFSPDYATARQRFLQAATQLGGQLAAHPVAGTGPTGEPLTIDICQLPGENTERLLLISSGLHGVEGFVGSAVQLALLERWASERRPLPVCCVLLHGLNPFGFAWRRRFDGENIDPNRNFMLPTEPFAGSPEKYPQLDGWLNPQRPPARWESFTLQALTAIARYGKPALRQAVAAGQYDFPKGLFFGGQAPCQSNRFLAEQTERLLGDCREVVHLDFHTGLGAWGACQLLLDYVPTDDQRLRLTKWFGSGSFQAGDAHDAAYRARGSLGRWCVARHAARDYLYVCVEFGTYGPIRVLGGLRAENQVHHWCQPSDAACAFWKARLTELFCPRSPAWRQRVIQHSLDLVDRALRGLCGG
ncbi:MAG: DUF2817 domain-containing protein [Planctomycetia bacterium]|nr:DUF2817 domain-containing protein [Planctomycetia bacterium]